MNYSSKIKITFILPSLRAGGAERVMSFVAQNINSKIFDVTLLIVGYEKDSQYNVSGINLIFLNESRVLKAIPKLLRYLWISKQDIIISAIGHLNTVMGLLSIFTPKTKFIAREVNVNSVLKEHSENKPLVGFHFISSLSKRFMDKIICQSNDMAADVINNSKVNKNKIIIINNPISKKFQAKKDDNQNFSELLKFITVGRLAKQKGHLRILEALHKLNIPFHYTIVGDGPEKDVIFDTISEYELDTSVTHIPYTTKVEEYLAKNDIFLQGSYVEGFPNALLESCAVGTPVLAFEAPGGIDEIIEEGVNGYIAHSIEDYVNKIELLSKSLKVLKPRQVSNSVLSKYSSEKILSQYENLFISLIEPNNLNT
ncbi:glycosyltransferase [Arenibacter aquaticus]|uniref:Glycosyltransferase n=1 Tax=Arenibacter aquaticus TaxID=2489054 RepID=A0A3S0AEK8_9FLAO|nr:glycosyltransferase [Arenibacter aquaticus]RTE53803.1 glycosyltransferase [Arenibacter aquaticus]